MSARIVTVFGATGAQGSSVVRALLADGTFTPRAVTRNQNSEEASKLKQLGIEVVQANQWDVTSLKKSMSGAEAVFGVTSFWDQRNFLQGPTSETILGKNLVDAAVQAGVKFFVWSSLPNATKVSNGRFRNMYHFDNKADVEEHLRNSGLPHANLHTGWFLENIWKVDLLTPTADSSAWELTIPRYDPDSPQYFTWVDRDLGQCVLALLKYYNHESIALLGETFYAISDKISYTDLAKKIEKALGKPVRFVTGPATGIKEIDETYDYQTELGLYPNTAIPDPRLATLGVNFHLAETFAEEELKKRYT